MLRDGKEIARRFALAGKSGGSGLVNFLRNFRQRVLGLREGQKLVIPGGFGQHNMLHVLEHEGYGMLRVRSGAPPPHHSLAT